MIDGAYFGTSFHSILFQVYPTMQPPKTAKRYEPKIYGFRVHAPAALARWQLEQIEDMKVRLQAEDIETGYVHCVNSEISKLILAKIRGRRR